MTGHVESVLLEAALGQLPVGVVLADAAGRIVLANARARELLGRNLVEELVTPSSPLARAVFDGELVADETVELDRPDGTSFIAVVTTTALNDAAGGRIGAVAVVEDVTVRNRLDVAEREFMTNAAHELRTPLAAIASAVEVLQQGAKELPSERDRFLEHIARESERLQRLARSLLLLARLEVQDEAPRIELVPMRPVLAEVAGAVTPGAAVTVSVRCARDLAVLANRDLLEHALVNITVNAARYTPAGSIRLSCRTEGETAVISVRDTGRGIRQPDVDRVFERFFRAGGRDAQGFGLGLSIARRAIEAIGGSIQLTSTEGKGTTVEIRLALARMVQT